MLSGELELSSNDAVVLEVYPNLWLDGSALESAAHGRVDTLLLTPSALRNTKESIAKVPCKLLCSLLNDGLGSKWSDLGHG
jgi:hypothetical protein